MGEQNRGIKNDLDAAIGLAITHIVLGIICVAFQYGIAEYESYLYNLGVPLWAGALFMATGGVGYALQSDKTPKLVRDYFSLSIISVFVATVVVTYGSVAAWADYADEKTLQGSIDVALAVVGFTEMCIAIASASVASGLRSVMAKYTPLRTVSTYYTSKDRTIILVPMSSDEIPLICLPDQYTVTDVKIKN